MFDSVKNGDTLLSIALRESDPQSAAILIRAGASLSVANGEEETPIDLLFTAFSLLECRRMKSKAVEADSELKITRLLVLKDAFATLFELVQMPLREYHSQLKVSLSQELTRIYTQFAPDRLSKIAQQMEDFEYQEQLLLDSVRRKYL